MLAAMPSADLADHDTSFRVPPPLQVTRVSAFEVVHIGATPIAQYAISDVTARRHVMVQLAEAGGVSGQDVARQFGVTPVYVSQLRSRYRGAGSAALLAGRRGPKGPSKVTPRLEARVRAWRAQGWSYEAIAENLAGTVSISSQTVRRIIERPIMTQRDLPAGDQLVGAETTTDHAEAAAVSPVAVSWPEGETRYAGAMLLHVALSHLGIWSVFHTVRASVGRTSLSVAQVVGIIALGFALRLRSIEGFKTALRRDFGQLLGLPLVPTVQTLRTRLRALAASVDPALVMRKLVEAWVQLEPVWEGAYYLDGHFCPYSGTRPVPKAWNAKRRLVEPGQTDHYVHDATGRALFFINRPFNDQLVTAAPQILAEIRAVAPRDQPILLIFDRGGYSGPLFKALTDQGIGFITYLKGRAARRRFPAEAFVRRWWEVTDPAGIQRPQRMVYRLLEKGTRIRGAGLVRTLVVEDDDAQVPILTNRPELPAAKVVHLLRMRWRQENSFKYLSAHYGVEQLIQHDATIHPDDRRLANPRRAQLRAQITAQQTEVVLKEADLARALTETRPEDAAPRLTPRMRQREIATLEARVARLEQRWKQTPAKVPAATLTGSATRATMNTDRRNLVNAIKIATYNAERWLARRFFKHYQDPRDWLTIFRSVLQLSGRVTGDGTDGLRVALRPPDQPRVRRALEAMLEEINRTDGRLFGDGPKLTFVVAAD
ncbi:MAG: helix-turn-helix domain-containing protein [Gemmatimonadaceae bacterium]|nr:helix-turn-helix domain-containing protein [Gemmatimonadaceae bacterium]